MSAQILYPAGTVISSNYPLIHVLREKHKSRYCDHCFKKSSSLKKCSKCSQMFYCDAACQKLDWKGKHKVECSIMAQLRSSKSLTRARAKERLTMRFYSLLKNETSAQKKFFLLPSSNHHQHGDDEPPRSFSLLDLCSQACGSCEISFDKIAPHVRFILDHTGRTLGYGLYVAEACSTGYSCAPNAVLSFDGTRAELRAMTDLRVGQPITTGLDLYGMPRIERRTFLKDEFMIDCHCEVCQDDCEEDFDFKGFSLLFSRIDELNDLMDQDLDCLTLYTISLKQLCVAFKKRCKYHHPRLTRILLSTFAFTRILLLHDLSVSVAEFDEMYPDLMESVAENLKITHDPSHDAWECFNDFVLVEDQEVPNLLDVGSKFVKF